MHPCTTGKLASAARPRAGAAFTRRDTLQFGDFQLDLGRELLVGPDGPRTLRPQALSVLRLLIERAPALVTLHELLDQVWGRHAISPSAVPQAVRDVRRALGDDSDAPRYIETRHRRGYRFLLPARPVEVIGERPAASNPYGAAVDAIAGRWSLPQRAANETCGRSRA